MPRARRVHFEGALFHVYNRLARGERIFEDEYWAERFVGSLREVAARNELSVLAWSVMPNHYHLMVRLGRVPLDRPIRSLQHGLSVAYNRKQQVRGPLWQDRYRAKLIDSEESWFRVLAYVHLNPVAAGMVSDPAEYRWSGHREIVGRPRQDTVVDVDRVLRAFGNTRRTARGAYVRRLKGAREEPWIEEEPGRLPWWRLGRPRRRDDDEDPQTALDRLREDRPFLDERKQYDVRDFLERGAELLDVSVEDLGGRGRMPDVLRARELLATLAVERYELQVLALGRVLGKHPGTVSGWIMRGSRRRREDPAFRVRMDEVDVALSPPADD